MVGRRRVMLVEKLGGGGGLGEWSEQPRLPLPLLPLFSPFFSCFLFFPSSIVRYMASGRVGLCVST